EDNPGDARLILELLGEVQTQAFDLERVARLDHALTRLSRTGVDVVLLDLGLPDSQGLETFMRARRGAPDEPIVVISGLDAERVVGGRADEVLARSALDLIHPEDVAAVSGRRLELQDHPGALVVMEARYRHKDGSWRYGECSVSNRLADPSVRALVMNYREIT